MDGFTPISALAGGALIGLASAILWIGNGRIAGISGIFGQLVNPMGIYGWRILFLAAMVGGALGSSALFYGFTGQSLIAQTPQLVGDPIWIGVAGLLVGLGTKIGNGCTSGHGVCGLSRLSLRSLVAVLVFFGTAIFTVAIVGVPS